MDGRRVAWDMEAYVARVRATCFVCELVAGTPGYEHHVVWRDGTRAGDRQTQAVTRKACRS